MAEILQGTTPTLAIKVDTTDFAVSDVTKLELVFQNGEKTTTHGLEDVTVDAENNSFVYTFSEEETLGFSPSFKLCYQLRFAFEDGSIVGTKKSALTIEDLISEESL